MNAIEISESKTTGLEIRPLTGTRAVRFANKVVRELAGLASRDPKGLEQLRGGDLDALVGLLVGLEDALPVDRQMELLRELVGESRHNGLPLATQLESLSLGEIYTAVRAAVEANFAGFFGSGSR